jgi:hypothetical protein
MKSSTTIFLTIALFICIACGSKDGNDKKKSVEEDNPELRLINEDATPLKGYKAIRQTVRERIVNDSSFEPIKYLQADNQNAGGSILALLGGYEGRGTTMSNQSAIPGPMNMLLWFTIVDGLAKDVGKHCSDTENLIPLSERVQTAIKNVCDISADPTESAKDLWDFLVKQDQSELQKQLWLELLNKDHYKDDRISFVHDAFVAALFSPEFLARR